MKKSRLILVVVAILSLLTVSAVRAELPIRKKTITPYKYLISASEKQQVVTWFKNATQHQWENVAKLSPTLFAKLQKNNMQTLVSSWDDFWGTAGISASVVNQICKVTGVFRDVQDKHWSKFPYRMTASEKQKAVSWVNSASVGALQQAGLGASAITNITANRPFSNFVDLWTTKGMSDTNMRKIAVAADAFYWVSGSIKTESLVGIGPAYRSKLNAPPLNIFTLQALLMCARYDEWRGEIARTISAGSEAMVKGLVLSWAKQASIRRLSGCGEAYAGLLMKVAKDKNVDLTKMSVFKNQNATQLREWCQQYLAAYNAEFPNAQVGTVPSPATFQKWIDQAAGLPDILVY